MKISKTRLRQLIVEEVENNESLIRAIENLTDRIEDLDISVDFLSAAFLGDSPLSIGTAQRQLGRAYRPTSRQSPQPPVSESVDLDNEACREMQVMIEERYVQLEQSEISEKEMRELKNQIDVLQKLVMMKGCKQ